MKKTNHPEGKYFMEDSREGERLAKKVNPYQVVDNFLKGYLDNLSGGMILDAGCGPGVFLEVIGKKYPQHTITGIDIGEDRIAQADRRLKEIVNAEAIQADVYTLPFPDDTFDFIYSRFMFEYLKYPVQAAKELFRVCKPGGKILLQDLDSQFTFYPETSPELKDALQIIKSKTGFDPDIGRKLFSIGRQAGFSFLKIDTQMYHKYFGRIDDFNYGLWDLKLDIAGKNLKSVMVEKVEMLKKEMLELLQDENSIMFSNLFTLTFEKI